MQHSGGQVGKRTKHREEHGGGWGCTSHGDAMDGWIDITIYYIAPHEPRDTDDPDLDY